MHRYPDVRVGCEWRGQAAHRGHGYGVSEQATSGSRAERHNQLRLNELQLFRQPPAARLHLAGVRLEVLYGIRDEHILARDSGVMQRTVENRSRRPDERVTFQVLRISRLLPDKH